jgi:hypothetical protein
MKTLLPETPIFSDHIIPTENMMLDEDRLSIYEFDVSFVHMEFILEINLTYNPQLKKH